MKSEDGYRYECQALEGFVQRVVVLAQSGYTYFVQGEVPERKLPEAVDLKLLTKYEPAAAASTRYRRKRRGLANVHYVRHGRDWVLLATPGKHRLFEEERMLSLRDTPIRVGGYAISLRRDGSEKRGGRFKLRVHVRIDKPEYLGLRDELLELATRRSREYLEARVWDSGFEPYAPVHRQLRAIVRQVNERRRRAGLERLSPSCVRIYRTLPKHFDRAISSEEEAA